MGFPSNSVTFAQPGASNPCDIAELKVETEATYHPSTYRTGTKALEGGGIGLYSVGVYPG